MLAGRSYRAPHAAATAALIRAAAKRKVAPPSAVAAAARSQRTLARSTRCGAPSLVPALVARVAADADPSHGSFKLTMAPVARVCHRPFSSCFSSAPAEDDDDVVDDDTSGEGLRGDGPAGKLRAHKYRNVSIKYASQGGTAQLFAMQLADAMQERDPDLAVTYRAWNENESGGGAGGSPPHQFLSDPDALHVFLCSTTGIGDAPENGRELYQWLMRASPADAGQNRPVDVCVFGLGNQVAHPSHYNLIGKNTYDKLVHTLNCNPIVPLGLGDDGDCIEDDFDRWQDLLLATLFSPEEQSSPPTDGAPNKLAEPIQPVPAPTKAPSNKVLREVRVVECPGSVSGKRRVSAKYPMLQLEASDSSMVRTHLMDDSGASALYPSDARLWSVAENRNLNPDPVANGLHQLVLAVDGGDAPAAAGDASPPPLYEAGDHLVVYPRNPDCVVEAYLQLLDDVSPHAIVRGIRSDVAPSSTGASPAYPYPLGLTVYETLSHCVDLSAVPSPSLARFILNRKDIDYKNDISKPRRTVLTLLKEQQDDASEAGISLEDLLFALAPIQGRYYSISSSSLKHPGHVRLLYRPVRYVSGRGYLREGLCSTYMSRLNERSSVVARVNCNPSFRLPADPTTPVVILAGGCGVAPFRAFFEQRQALQEAGQPLGECYLFVGFRNPADAVWTDLMTEGLRSGTLTHSHVAYTTGVPNASPLLTAVFRESAKEVWDAIQQRDGHLYICGGAQSFGAAVKRELIDMAVAHGGHDAATATRYLQELAQAGRLCEDLAD